MNAKIGGKFYFDITDILDYAIGHDRVSGVQRVVINVICNFSAKYGKKDVRCLFLNRQTGMLMETDASALMSDREFNPEMLRYKFRPYPRWTGFPDRELVKAHLRPFRENGNELLRTVRKWEIYISSLLWPKRLRRYGLERIRDRYNNEPQSVLTEFKGLASGDSLVSLGCNWQCEPILELARRHRQGGGDVVQMVYDLIPLKFPEYFLPHLTAAFNYWLKNISEVCSRYLCISDWTARDLREYLHGSRPDAVITVIPLAHEVSGFSRNTRVQNATPRIASLLNEPFVLCVGTVEIRKNGILLLRAWARLAAELKERLPRLVFAGRRGWLIDEFDRLRVENPALQRYVELVDSPLDGELAVLYSNCLFTAFPSLYEGWGLPVGEAAWFGKYCVASNASSIPEVCGDLIDYSAPDDLEGFIGKLRRAVCDRSYLLEREARIKTARLRTWREVAEKIDRVLLDVASKKC